MKAIYIGAGIDIRPVNLFKNITEFVYVDCQPFSEFGIETTIQPDGSNGFARPRFLDNLKKEMNKNNFVLKEQCDDKIIYSNTNQTITYFINTAIPEHIDKIKDAIADFDILIVVGYNPHSIIMEYTTKKIIFIGFSGTCYDYYEDEGTNSVTNKLHKCADFRNKFKFFLYIDKQKYLNKYTDWIDFPE